MNKPTYLLVNEDREQELLQRGLRAQLELAMKSGGELVKEHRERMAYSLMAAGVTLIPSEHLIDTQIVVSQGIYDAAKRICDLGGATGGPR